MARFPIEKFLELSAEIPVIDVRTPNEYAAGHIPGAINIPLFSNEERAVVGTDYKKLGRHKAMLQAMDFVGPRMSSLVREAEILAGPTGRLLVHCWRGGMRSESVAWLYNLYGLEAHTLEKGYKAFRNYVVDSWKIPLSLQVLGGYTGSKKTEILTEISRLGHPVLDLEYLASHRGSVFGHINLKAQPTQEQFENDLALALRKLPRNTRIWIEDESRHIGRLIIPNNLYDNIRSSPLVFLDVDEHARVTYLSKLYGQSSVSELKELVLKIERRLGGQRAREAISAIEEQNLDRAAAILLSYYDRSYSYGVNRRQHEPLLRLSFHSEDVAQIAETILARLAD